MKHPNMTIFFRKILAVALCLGLLFSGLKLTTTLSAAEEMPEYDGPEIAYVYVEGVTIQNAVSETQTEAETIIVDEDTLQLKAIVAPDDADERMMRPLPAALYLRFDSLYFTIRSV